ncbi:MAG: PaaI family thioesterase [Chloroflexota bacterium]|nr:PaaI family thioesterase [Chloroflexota bacterium]
MSEISTTWQPQPTSRMCFVCGRENPMGLHMEFFTDHAAGQVVASVTIPEQYQGYPGIVHGGIVSAILDEVSGRAIMSVAKDNPFWVTAKLEVRYRQPTPTETPLQAVGWLVKQGNRSAQVAGELRLEDGTVTAEVAAVVVRPKPETLAEWERERQFWQSES